MEALKLRLVQLISTGTLFLTISPHFQIFQLAILKIYRYPISQNIPTSFSVYYESFYESFICKSSFLHSSSRAIKKNVRLGRSLYNELFRGIGNLGYQLCRALGITLSLYVVLSSTTMFAITTRCPSPSLHAGRNTPRRGREEPGGAYPVRFHSLLSNSYF